MKSLGTETKFHTYVNSVLKTRHLGTAEVSRNMQDDLRLFYNKGIRKGSLDDPIFLSYVEFFESYEGLVYQYKGNTSEDVPQTLVDIYSTANYTFYISPVVPENLGTPY